MDRKVHETTYLCVEIMNSIKTTSKEETRSGHVLQIPFAV